MAELSLALAKRTITTQSPARLRVGHSERCAVFLYRDHHAVPIARRSGLVENADSQPQSQGDDVRYAKGKAGQNNWCIACPAFL